MAALATKWLIRRSRWWAAAAVGVVDVEFHVFVQLLEEESAL
jgi:hypothetical protein